MKPLYKSTLLALLALLTVHAYAELSKEIREKRFVYLDEIDPTIKTSLRYATHENFVGKPLDGYKTLRVIITQQAAEALKAVQADLQRDGYSLVVYDAYRPQKAVNHFIRWSTDIADQRKKDQYYPRINKEDVFVLGYVGKRSGHSRGSTVDLTIIKNTHELREIEADDRHLLDGYIVKFLDDGTVNMYTSFDLFDVASHANNKLIPEEYKVARNYLKTIMEKHGFRSDREEWWHFTLRDEPFPADQDSSYFDFDIE